MCTLHRQRAREGELCVYTVYMCIYVLDSRNMHAYIYHHIYIYVYMYI